jgi:hypothetical protein
MANLANINAVLGRHTDALVMQEKVLECFQRVSPEDHPNIGEVDVVLHGLVVTRMGQVAP